MIQNDPRVRNGFVKLPHNFFHITRELSVAEKFFLVYLLSMDNFFGDKGEVYFTDEEARKDLRVGRSSIKRWRERLKTTLFIDYLPGKYKGIATTYNVKGIKMMLSNEKERGRVSKRDAKRAKMNHKAYQDEPERVSKWHNTKEVKEEVKEEGKKEPSEGSASACLVSQASPSLGQDLKNGSIREDLKKEAESLLRDKGPDEAIGFLQGQGDLTHSEAYNTILELRGAQGK
ncbi:hypothetical protein ACFL1K_01670 [Candidatus Omnitrophota bacterium]